MWLARFRAVDVRICHNSIENQNIYKGKGRTLRGAPTGSTVVLRACTIDGLGRERREERENTFSRSSTNRCHDFVGREPDQIRPASPPPPGVGIFTLAVLILFSIQQDDTLHRRKHVTSRLASGESGRGGCPSSAAACSRPSTPMIGGGS